MAILADPEELLAGAADREIGPAVLADLLAHEVAPVSSWLRLC